MKHTKESAARLASEVVSKMTSAMPLSTAFDAADFERQMASAVHWETPPFSGAYLCLRASFGISASVSFKARVEADNKGRKFLSLSAAITFPSCEYGLAEAPFALDFQRQALAVASAIVAHLDGSEIT